MPKIIQPNFEKQFFDFFSTLKKGVFYKIRNDSNFTHDLHFLKSLIRDAKFQLNNVRHSNQKVEINLTRLRWELNTDSSNSELIEIPSILKITGVKQIKYSLTNVTTTKPFSGNLIEENDIQSINDFFEVDGLFVGEKTFLDSDENIELVFFGYPAGWVFRVFVDKEKFSLSIKDKQN